MNKQEEEGDNLPLSEGNAVSSGGLPSWSSFRPSMMEEALVIPMMLCPISCQWTILE